MVRALSTDCVTGVTMLLNGAGRSMRNAARRRESISLAATRATSAATQATTASAGKTVVAAASAATIARSLVSTAPAGKAATAAASAARKASATAPLSTAQRAARAAARAAGLAARAERWIAEGPRIEPATGPEKNKPIDAPLAAAQAVSLTSRLDRAAMTPDVKPARKLASVKCGAPSNPSTRVANGKTRIVAR